MRDEYTDMTPIWADLRNKMEDAGSELPQGTIGPIVNDDQGNVAMATIATATSKGAKSAVRCHYSRDMPRFSGTVEANRAISVLKRPTSTQAVSFGYGVDVVGEANGLVVVHRRKFRRIVIGRTPRLPVQY